MVRFVTVVTVAMGYRNGEDLGGWGGCPSGTFLADPVGVITGENDVPGEVWCSRRFGLRE